MSDFSKDSDIDKAYELGVKANNSKAISICITLESQNSNVFVKNLQNVFNRIIFVEAAMQLILPVQMFLNLEKGSFIGLDYVDVAETIRKRRVPMHFTHTLCKEPNDIDTSISSTIEERNKRMGCYDLYHKETFIELLLCPDIGLDTIEKILEKLNGGCISSA